ncbi:MAG: hypothetical protein ACRCTP_04295 [Aeromonas popoffii]|uniref:hypothetical protein n=1 Tax=Aeromonas popoffii TaxID=70856 RepID=UPI003F2B86BD
MTTPDLLKEILRQSHRVAARIDPNGGLLTPKEKFLGDVGRLVALQFTMVEQGMFTEEEIYQAVLKAKGDLQK